MIHLSKKTKTPVQEIRKRADEYFGTGGLGLDAVDARECSGCYEGGGISKNHCHFFRNLLGSEHYTDFPLNDKKAH